MNGAQTEAAWSNAIGCVLTDNPFFADLALATVNDGSPEGAARWLLSFVSDFLRGRGQPCGPLDAFDFASPDIEAMVEIWPRFRAAAELYAGQRVDYSQDGLGTLARYLVERMPTIWDGGYLHGQPPVTRCLALADRIDTLVGFFGIGIKPTGSKDPFALRRAALNVLRAIMFPVTAPQALAA